MKLTGEKRKFYGKVIEVNAEDKNELGGIGFMDVWMSTEDEDHHGEVVKSFAFNESIDLAKETGKFPPFLANHMMVLADGDVPVIGRVTSMKEVPGKGSQARVALAPEEVQPKAKRWLAAYAGGWMTDVSVGFLAREIERPENKALEHHKSELVELSGATVGSNATATAIEVQRKSLADLLERGVNDAGDAMPDEVRELLVELKAMAEEALQNKAVVPFKSYPKADESRAWDWDTAAQDAVLGDDDFARFKGVHAWFDDSESSVPETKGAYKLPHHEEIDGDLRTNFRGVVAGMGALLGARGGVDIPEGDRRGVYNHLAKHYREFDREAPEFRTLTADEFIAKTHEAGIAFTAVDLGLADPPSNDDDATEIRVRARRGDDGALTFSVDGIGTADVKDWLDSDEGRKALAVEWKRALTAKQIPEESVSEDDDNVFIQIAPTDIDYDDATLREIELVGGDRAVMATVGVVAGDDTGTVQITFLRFPKSAGWDMAGALEWAEAADLDALLSAALNEGDSDEGAHRPEDKKLAEIAERMERAADRCESAAAKMVGVHEASIELAARSAQLLDSITTYTKPAAQSASVRSVPPRDATDTDDLELDEETEADLRALHKLTARAVGDDGAAGAAPE